MRAVAVLSVVLYHGWPNWFVGGFIGVDVFFVISGYLITSIILTQLETNDFSIASFYSRRVRRIFPALLLVLVVTLGFGWITLLSGEFQQVGKHTAAGGSFISNLVLWHESGYFDNSATTKPLLHLWSLGVEEQFYFLWPLILWLVFKKKMNFLLVTTVIFVISMASNILTVGTDPSAAFFSPLTRFWELMAGGIAAYWHLYRPTWSARQKNSASVIGAAMLIAGFSLIKPQDLFPGWWAILPVAGVFLLIMAGPSSIINRAILSRKIMVSIGLISYPLYLWHWPLLSFGFIIHGEKPTYQIKIALILLAFALAYLTYRYLEVPLRTRRKKNVVASLSGAMVAIIAIGLSIHFGLLKERINVHGADIYLNALNDSDFPGQSFTPYRHNGIVFQKISSTSPKLTVFIGDSLIQQYGPYIEQTMAKSGNANNSVIFATAGGCPPIQGTIRLPLVRFPICPKIIDAAYDLANQDDVDTVVIGAAWYGYFKNNYAELLVESNGKRYAFPEEIAMEKAYQSLQTSVELLKKHGKRVYLIMQPPSGGAFDPRNMYAGSRFKSIYPLPQIPDVAVEKFLRESAGPRKRLSAIAEQTGAVLIDPLNYLCSQETCPVLDAEGKPLYTDPIHMRPAYARRVASYLAPTLLPAASTKASRVEKSVVPSS
ncbi:acyltransferase family protein [Janthinobacterium tructae]|uniref:Acyltransferase n=1 Tax=Janthinobacterium tructae TaxID=2590869 RepID=A0A4Y6RJX0_9BURK|nr:acyltransferase family protein [Janthinobacterium tructae]QDG73332.1 acyltransferase [Janthinobacterium tructae]